MVVAIDFETTMRPAFLPWHKGAYPVCFSAATSTGIIQTWFFNHPSATQSQAECISEIRDLLSQADRIIAHNMKFDYHWLTHLGLVSEDVQIFCTLVAEYLLEGQIKLDGLKLGQLCDKYGIPTKKDRVQVYWDAGKETDEVPMETLQVYCEQDCVNALALYMRQATSLGKLGLISLFSLEMEVLKAFADIERNGMAIDTDLLEVYSEEYGTRLNELDTELSHELDIPNVGSKQQLSAALFGGTYKYSGVEQTRKELKDGTVKLGERKARLERHMSGVFNPERFGVSKTVSGYSTDVSNLSKLRGNSDIQKRILTLLTERSKVQQMKSTYFDSLQTHAVDGLIHPSVNQTIAKTGRTTCSNPNLQNQPRGNTGPVKQCFISRFKEEE